MKRFAIVLIASFLCLAVLQQCSSAKKVTNLVKKKTEKNVEAKPIFNLVKSDSFRSQIDTSKLKEKPKPIIVRDTIIKVDSTTIVVLKDSLSTANLKIAELRDSIKLERNKLINAYQLNDTLILQLQHKYDAKILAMQKNLAPKTYYRLVPYTVVEKDLNQVFVTALLVALIAFSIAILYIRKIRKEVNKIDFSNEHKKIIERLKDN